MNLREPLTIPGTRIYEVPYILKRSIRKPSCVLHIIGILEKGDKNDNIGTKFDPNLLCFVSLWFWALFEWSIRVFCRTASETVSVDNFTSIPYVSLSRSLLSWTSILKMPCTSKLWVSGAVNPTRATPSREPIYKYFPWQGVWVC